MLIYNSNSDRVKFISYTGNYPCLCMGVLTLEIDGIEYRFGHDYSNYHFNEDHEGYFSDEDPNRLNFDTFWHTGGSCGFDSEWNELVTQGKWQINVDELPQQFVELAEEIDMIFNENVPYGCCGGCI